MCIHNVCVGLFVRKMFYSNMKFTENICFPKASMQLLTARICSVDWMNDYMNLQVSKQIWAPSIPVFQSRRVNAQRHLTLMIPVSDGMSDTTRAIYRRWVPSIGVHFVINRIRIFLWFSICSVKSDRNKSDKKNTGKVWAISFRCKRWIYSTFLLFIVYLLKSVFGRLHEEPTASVSWIMVWHSSSGICNAWISDLCMS